jgi:DHA2 family multidrug resistance protein
MAAAVPNRGFITAAIMAAALMQSLDTTIANVALPHIQGSVSASQDQITWVLTFYIVAAGIMTPLTGWLSQRFGARVVFLSSVAGFTVMSALCGAAQSLGEIVVFRFLQGIAGAALLPLAQAVLLDINPPEKQGQAMATFSLAVVLAPIMGPVIGGYFTDDYSWRWCFLVNVPVGILTFIGAWLFLPRKHANTAPKFDFFGFVYIALSVASLQLMLDRGETQDWFGSMEIWVEAVVAGLSFYLFVVHMLTAPSPLFSHALFRDRNFNASLIATLVVMGALYASLALSPPMLQGVYGYPVFTAGLILTSRGAGTFLMMLPMGRLMQKADLRVLMGVGIVAIAASFWMMTGFAPTMGAGPFIISGFIQGLAISLVWVPLSVIAFATLPEEIRVQGTALWNVFRNLGSSGGISLLEALLTVNTQVAHSTIVSHVRLDNPNLRQVMPEGVSSKALQMVDAMANRQATVIAYLDDFKLLGVAMLAMIPLLLLMRRPSGSVSGHAAMME